MAWPYNGIIHIPSNSPKCPFVYEAQFPTIDKPFDFVYHLVVWDDPYFPPPPELWNLCFAAKGDIFIIFFVFSVLIFFISGYATYVCFNSPTAGTTHRKALFLCLLGASTVRLVYSSIGLHKVRQVRTMADVLVAGKFFVKTLVPVMSLSDWFTGLVDVVMAFFWYTIQSNLEHFPTTWFALAMLGSGKILAMIVAYDVDYVFKNFNSDPLHFFDELLWYIAVMVLVGALSHIVVAVAVIRSALRTSSSVVWWSRFKALWPIFTIVVVTVASGLVRAGALIGRQTGVAYFYSGDMSFNNSTFTTVYFISIMQIPPLIVALIAATMTAKSAKEAAAHEREAAQLVLDRGSGYGGTGTVHEDSNSDLAGRNPNYSGRIGEDETDEM